MAKDKQRATQQKAKKLGLSAARHHIFMCLDKDEADCAAPSEMSASWKHLRRRLKEAEIGKRAVLRSKCSCLGICRGGPILVVYPDGVWYGNCTPEVIDRIVQEHLIEGRVVEEHVIARRA